MENPIRDFDMNQPYTMEEIRGAIQGIKERRERFESGWVRNIKIIATMWFLITVVLAVMDNAAGETIVMSVIFLFFASIITMLVFDETAGRNYTVEYFVFMNTQNEIDNIIPRGSSEKVISYAKKYAPICEYVKQVHVYGRDLLLMELSEFDKWVEHEKIRDSYSEIVNC
ncbi:MAG: hypothetical protein M1492_08320 [Gammaproteobacteria bacterium]|nr:hypothetical protein [Gammaproteobacteria bacterium]